jgi:hypothetical protein
MWRCHKLAKPAEIGEHLLCLTLVAGFAGSPNLIYLRPGFFMLQRVE